MSRTSTVQAHGRIWPLRRRRGVDIQTVGHEAPVRGFPGLPLAQIERRYDVEIDTHEVDVFFMSPKDQAEKYALDEAAVSATD